MKRARSLFLVGDFVKLKPSNKRLIFKFPILSISDFYQIESIHKRTVVNKTFFMLTFIGIPPKEIGGGLSDFTFELVC